jgi:hypothetical protein
LWYSYFISQILLLGKEMKRSDRSKASLGGLKPPNPMSDRHEHRTGNNNADDHRRRVEGEVRVTGQIKADLPPDLVEEYKTANRDNTSREGKRFIIERVTLGLVILVAFLNIVQSWQAIKSANAATQAVIQSATQFQQDQRPYVSQTIKSSNAPTWFPSGDGQTGQVLWNWGMTNFGKTPAQNIRFTQEMRLGEGEWKLTHGGDRPGCRGTIGSGTGVL